MANETLTGTVAAHTATEILARAAIKAHLPKMVLSSLVHRDDLGEARSNQKRYIVDSDLGVSSAGAEGVALTPTLSIGMGTSVNVSVSEGVADMALLTELAISTALGIDMDTVQRIMSAGTQEQFLSLLAPFVNRLIPRGMQKIESDLLALLSGLGTSVGTTNTDCSIANLLAAQYQYRINQATRPITEARYLLTENQANEVNLEALSTSGGVQGAIWNQQANYGMANRPADGEAHMVQGLLGPFLGYPVHTYDSELNVNANGVTDVIGGFGVFGDAGRAPDDVALGGKPGAFVLLNRGSLKLRFQEKLDHRAAGVVMNAYYGVGELVDKNVVAIITDAP